MPTEPTNELLPNEIWAQLDPNAGRLPRRQVRRLATMLVILAVVVAAGAVVWRAGLLTTRLSVPGGGSFGVTTGSFTLGVRVANDGWQPVTVTSIGRSGPGLVLEHTFGAPYRLASHASQDFVLRYRVTGCDAVPSRAWPVPVRVQRWYGAGTVYVQPLPIDIGVPDGATSFSGPDPYAREWQRALADIACGRATP